MACHELTEDRQVLASENKILLMGSPNVGKSVFFLPLPIYMLSAPTMRAQRFHT